MENNTAKTTDTLFRKADKLLMDLRVKNLPLEKDLYDIQALLFQIQDMIEIPLPQSEKSGETETVIRSMLEKHTYLKPSSCMDLAKKISDLLYIPSHVKGKSETVGMPTDMPDLFTDMAQQIYHESVVRGQDMSSITECFNKLQDGYKRECVSTPSLVEGEVKAQEETKTERP